MLTRLKEILREAEAVQVDLDGTVARCRRTLLFLKRESTARYLTPKYQAKLAALCQHHLDALTVYKVDLTRTLHYLEGLQAEAERLLHRLYAAKLEKMRVTDQKQFVEGKLHPITKRIRTVKYCISLVDLFIDNLKQTHWTITRLQAALDVTVRLEKGS